MPKITFVIDKTSAQLKKTEKQKAAMHLLSTIVLLLYLDNYVIKHCNRYNFNRYRFLTINCEMTH